MNTKENNTKTQRLATTDTEQDETGTPYARKQGSY